LFVPLRTAGDLKLFETEVDKYAAFRKLPSSTDNTVGVCSLFVAVLLHMIIWMDSTVGNISINTTHVTSLPLFSMQILRP